ncbi:hypothetical protein CXIVA_25280 [Clostridium sp. SY8519]|uniref:LysR family transcriptional regulator n=1 Tax=Clostridium sp. (strain SY8519) TaxID=1042156 RepID=UPI00021722C2|nr:LysR family transcriptional regulator [Clostridium sp. SY8519]BAK48496.1 hypothetical protein CXIVA_25280 [Clostridium sp. SY8519]
MDLNKLVAFISVAKNRNFTRAAEELFISQPALSKKISDFEKEMGTQLLIRDNRNVTLTSAGETLYLKAPFLLDALADLEQEIKRISDSPAMHLSIACTGVEYGRFTPFINQFKTVHPDIDINLQWCSAKEAQDLIYSNVFDFAFQMNMEASEEDFSDFWPFYYDHLDVIVNNYHPMRLETEVSLNDFIGDKFIITKSQDNHLPYNYLLNRMAENDIKFPKGIIAADSLNSMVLQVSAGNGIAVLNHSMEKMYGQMVKFIPLIDSFQYMETDLVWNKLNHNPAIEILLDFLKEDNEKINLEKYKYRNKSDIKK